MGYKALQTVMLGVNEPVHEGDEIPATYLDIRGEEQKVDFERLVELGAAEKVAERSSGSQRKSSK